MLSFLTLWVHLQNFETRVADREDGVVSVEYAVLGAALVIAIGAAMVAFKPKLVTEFTNLLP